MAEEADRDQHGHGPEHEAEHAGRGGDRIAGRCGRAQRRVEQSAGQESEHNAENKVQGCVSQVWLSRRIDQQNGAPVLRYIGDSDAHIVRGLVAILLTLYSGRTAQEILSTDALAVFDEFGLREHLTPQRSNGLRSMVARIRSDATQTLAEAS